MAVVCPPACRRRRRRRRRGGGHVAVRRRQIDGAKALASGIPRGKSEGSRSSPTLDQQPPRWKQMAVRGDGG